MKVIKEFKIKNKSCYRVQEIIKEQIISDKVINVEQYSTYIDGKRKTIIYHTDKTFDEDVYKYLNNEINFLSENTQRKFECAFKVMTVWEEIIGKRFTEFNYRDVQKFVFFLYGKSSLSGTTKMELKTCRSSETVNIILSEIKALYKSVKQIFGYEEITPFDNLLKERNYSNPRVYLGNEISDALGSQMYKEIPKYIKPEEFNHLLDITQSRPLPKRTKKNRNKIRKIKATKLRDDIMLCLMFHGGLRIGEVLGLTMEDFEFVQNDNGENLCKIIIRNRVSDKNFQNAKTVQNVKEKTAYRTSTYYEKDIGYQEVCILEDLAGLYEKINDYIDSFHRYAEKKLNAKYKETIADAVGEFKKIKKTNHYLFLNELGGLLKYSAWNKHLRQIYEDAGLQVDFESRKVNLSHRLRHGFVMKLISDYKVRSDADLVYIMKRTRHKSIQSLYVYINPTLKEIINQQVELENFILNNQDNEMDKDDN